MHALHLEHVGKRYASGTEALKDISLSIPEGDFFALLGPNGAGKTTLIGITTGVVTKTSGTLSVFGVSIDENHSKAKTFVGIVPQEPNFNIFESPRDVVVNQAGYYGIPRASALPRAEKLLTDLGIGEKMHRPSMELSGGMKRRLLIARALIHEPKLLILDEPTAGVDVELRRGMWEYLKKINKEGTTILLTTHYLEEAEQLAKHVAVIHKGSIIKEGTVKDLIAQLQVERLILDLTLPVTESLLHALHVFNPTPVDATTLSVEIGAGRGLSDVMNVIHAENFRVQTVRSENGKLEEVFINLTKN